MCVFVCFVCVCVCVCVYVLNCTRITCVGVGVWVGKRPVPGVRRGTPRAAHAVRDGVGGV